MEFLTVAAISVAVLTYIAWPLRTGAAPDAVDPQLLLERERLAVAKDRKIDELRELIGDRQAGKLDATEARELERTLRGQAADLLHRLDELDARIAATTPAEPRERQPDPVG